LEYYDKLSNRVKEVYLKLTGEKGGLATLNIIDRDKPYLDNIK
jgi:hypothetical protein